MSTSPLALEPAGPSEPLAQQLCDLKLALMAEHHEDLAKEAAHTQTSHLEYLSELVQGEARLRRDQATQNRVRQARFPVIKTLDQFRWDWPHQINQAQVKHHCTLSFLSTHTNLIYLGGVGLGKTHLAMALGYTACLKGHSVLFTSAIDVINTLSQAKFSNRQCSYISSSRMPPLERTREVIERVNAIMGHTPGVDHWISVGGFSLLSGANASNAAPIRSRCKPIRRFGPTRTTSVASMCARLRVRGYHLLGTLVTVDEAFNPQMVTRYNLYSAASITGQAAPGYSSGQALTLMEQMAGRKSPPAMGYEWTGMAYQEKQIGSQAILIFALALALVYLVLAAQYESWTSPAAVILSVPLALLGTVLALVARSMDNNIYTQVGIVLLIALASKNAILIVEFAQESRSEGKGILDAALEAARLRFRPILMTSCSTLLRMVPLVVASGAGAAGRRALGTAVFGGLVATTVLVVFFAPVFYVVMQRLSEWRSDSQDPTPTADLEAHN